jgi:hypothetical protein
MQLRQQSFGVRGRAKASCISDFVCKLLHCFMYSFSSGLRIGRTVKFIFALGPKIFRILIVQSAVRKFHKLAKLVSRSDVTFSERSMSLRCTLRRRHITLHYLLRRRHITLHICCGGDTSPYIFVAAETHHLTLLTSTSDGGEWYMFRFYLCTHGENAFDTC